MRAVFRSVLLSAALLAVLVFSGCVTVKVNLFEEAEPLKEKVVSGKGWDKILLLDISGMIMDKPRGRLWGLTGGTGPSRVKEELEKAAQDGRIKAVVVRINSPGGTVNGADMIHHELAAFKAKHHVPVVACFLGLAASGGYYVAMAADVIVAQPANLTGSIGVLAMKPNLKGLMDKFGVEQDVVKSGQWKDFWSPFRPANAAEKRMMQEIIDDYHRRFVEVVATGRRLDQRQVAKLADGRIYTAARARDLGLVDKVGYLDEAIAEAKARAGLTEARVVVYHRPGTYRPTIYSLVPDLLGDMSPQFLYLWWPGEPG
ncbi:MAG: signal peptide peptidase SppA [Deltaproteobacteria bacterium]|nr:signal peptide peptidase SppA [Deltaproteobacteria bacterium]